MDAGTGNDSTALLGQGQGQKSAEFWLHDGSIVLLVEKRLFRVHQTILVNHSQIFADLFGLPQSDVDADAEVDAEASASGGGGGDSWIEGCRVVELQDRAEDFEDLLRAIYHPSHFDKLPAAADLDVLLTFVGGILRLSTKYIIPELRKRCAALLMARFPTSYQSYIATAPRSYTPAMSRSPTVDQSGTHTSITSQEWASNLAFSLVSHVIQSTSQTALPALNRYHPTQQSPTSSQPSLVQPSPPNSSSQSATLVPSPPAAAHHHHASRSRRHSSHNNNRDNRDRDRDRDRDKPKPKPKEETPPKPKGSSIMRAIALANETNVLTILPYAYYLLARTSDPRRYLSHSPSSLSWHQKTVILVGRTYLHSAEVSMSHSFLVAFEASPSCVTPEMCKAARGPLVEWALLGTTGRGPEPLRPWERWDKLGVCPMCVSHAKRRHDRGKEEVWDRLPEFFELVSWNRLRELQEL